MAESLEIGAHGVTVILATWLGLIVLTRAGGQRGARVFAFVTRPAGGVVGGDHHRAAEHRPRRGPGLQRARGRRRLPAAGRHAARGAGAHRRRRPVHRTAASADRLVRRVQCGRARGGPGARPATRRQRAPPRAIRHARRDSGLGLDPVPPPHLRVRAVLDHRGAAGGGRRRGAAAPAAGGAGDGGHRRLGWDAADPARGVRIRAVDRRVAGDRGHGAGRLRGLRAGPVHVDRKRGAAPSRTRWWSASASPSSSPCWWRWNG